MGSAKAAVFPVPVWAVPIRSLPARIIGKARSWIGVGSAKPIACTPRTTSAERSKLLNDTACKLAPVAQVVIPSAVEESLAILSQKRNRDVSTSLDMTKVLVIADTHNKL